MLGMDKNTLLKIHIIDLLDSLQVAISLKELQEKIGYASLGTIRLNCKELQTMIDTLYVENHYSLKLSIDNRRGIQLVRSSTNLQTLISYLYQQDLACEILCLILSKRTISAVQFCMDNSISESKLRRKIKEINCELADYDLYISCSTNIRLRGREIDIRRFYYIFMRVLYRQFEQIEWANTAGCMKVAKNIEEHLSILNTPTNIETISFWLFVTNQSLSTKGQISFNLKDKEKFDYFDYPEKPSFFKNWNIDEWRFFVIAIYSSGLQNFDLPSNCPNQELFLEQVVTHWSNSFTKHFQPLSSHEQENLAGRLKQHYIAFKFFQLNESLVDIWSNAIALRRVRSEFPYYYRRFTEFWQEFTKAVPDFDYRQLRLYSFLTCVKLYSLENCLPKISVYTFSEQGELASLFIKDKICLHFKNRYRLTFVEDPQDAQLIIGTSPSFKTFLSEEQKSVIIRSNISTTDYDDIESVLKLLVEKDLAEKIG